MSPENVSAGAFRDKLFKIIETMDEKELVFHLKEPPIWTKRTNLFLGAAGKIGDWEGNKKTRDTCLLAALYNSLYQDPPGFPIPQDLSEKYEHITDEKLVWFEAMRYDCIFLPYRRVRLKNGSDYPLAWTYDWVIEVENNFKEFSFTLRGLLDINCRKRMGIFFSDIDSENPEQLLTKRSFFKPVWELYKQAEFKEAPLQSSCSLYALIFPETFTTVSEYCGKAILIRWNERDSFVVEP